MNEVDLIPSLVIRSGSTVNCPLHRVPLIPVSRLLAHHSSSYVAFSGATSTPIERAAENA